MAPLRTNIPTTSLTGAMRPAGCRHGYLSVSHRHTAAVLTGAAQMMSSASMTQEFCKQADCPLFVLDQVVLCRQLLAWTPTS